MSEISSEAWHILNDQLNRLFRSVRSLRDYGNLIPLDSIDWDDKSEQDVFHVIKLLISEIRVYDGNLPVAADHVGVQPIEQVSPACLQYTVRTNIRIIDLLCLNLFHRFMMN